MHKICIEIQGHQEYSKQSGMPVHPNLQGSVQGVKPDDFVLS